jgi:DnaJ family protein B protein 4
MTSYYDILGVSREADDTTIKKAYRKLSLEFHPDRNPAPEAKARFQEISEAYEHLSDPQKRAEYDMMQAGGGGIHMNMWGMGGMGGSPIPGMPAEIFHMMFGGGMGGMFGGGGAGGANIHVFENGVPFTMHMNGGGFHPFQQHPLQKPPSIIQNVQITFEQSFSGCTIPVSVEKWMQTANVRTNVTEVMYLTIPAGTDNKEVIILSDCGNTINEQVKGYVKFVIDVQNTSPFVRQGMDLVYRKQLTLKEALTGFSFEVPHVSGKMLAINNKTNSTVVSPQYKKVIPNLGMTRNNHSGNLIIEFDVAFPETLTKEQIEKLVEVL